MTQPDTLHTRLRDEIQRRLDAARAIDTGLSWTYAETSFGPKVRVGNDEEAYWSRECNTQVWTCDDEQDGCPEVARGWAAEGEHIALHDPADAVRRYTGELEVLQRHAIIWRDIGYMDDEREEQYEEIPVCGRCVPKHSHFSSRAEVPEGPCVEVKAVAGRLGVSVDG